jgi:hypothetical protein
MYGQRAPGGARPGNHEVAGARMARTRVTDNQFRIVVAIVALALVVVVVRLRFCYAPSLPDKPPRPTVDLAAAEKKVRASEGVYREHLASDARAVGLEAPTIDQMRVRFPHRADDSGWTLAPGDVAIEAAGLRIRAITRRPEVGKHSILALEITNTTDEPLAYRVDTRPTRGTRSCGQREAMPYNGLTIEPGETIVRGECVYKRGWGLAIDRVESVSLPPLPYVYVSKIQPVVTNLEPRLARDHRPGGRVMCEMAVPAAVISSLERGQIAWRDVIDFYGRHRCETYKFPVTYKAFSGANDPELPVTPD